MSDEEELMPMQIFAQAMLDAAMPHKFGEGGHYGMRRNTNGKIGIDIRNFYPNQGHKVLAIDMTDDEVRTFVLRLLEALDDV